MTKTTTRPVGNPWVIVWQDPKAGPTFFAGTMNLGGGLGGVMWDYLPGARLFRKLAIAERTKGSLRFSNPSGVKIVRWSEAEQMVGEG